MKKKDDRQFQWQPQRIRGKTWKLQTKRSSKKFCYVRDFATATGDEVNANIALEVVHFGGLREDFVLYFSEIIKTTWIWWKTYLLFLSRILQYAYKMI